MLCVNGIKAFKVSAIAFFMSLILSQGVFGQTSILDSTFTFNEGTVKTGKALGIITRKTGYNFTYDSRLIDQNRETELTFNNTKLRSVITGILDNDSLILSVIDKYIIISQPVKQTTLSTVPVDTLSLQTRYVTGKVIEAENSQPLPYAAIAIKNRARGTVTNINGDFGIKIPPEMINDTLSISYLGFVRREIPIRDAFRDKLKIPMQRDFISIPEIIIKNQNPADIITKSVRNIGRNYGSSPVCMTAFYREGVMKKSELQTYSEAVLQIYKSAYTATIFNDQIKVYKSRKIENTDRHDTLAIRLKAGLSTCLELDGAKNIFDFLTNTADYAYRMTDIVTFNEESAYAIEFEQRPNVELPLFKGTVYINTNDFAIVHAEFEINPKLIDKIKNSFVAAGSHGFNTWPTSVKYTVSYSKMDNRYFLNHVRGDLIFTSSQKRRLFRLQFKVFFELAVTETRLDNVERFDREELAPIHSVFSRTITNYDSDFWGNQDFLKPEDNLLHELKNMNVKLLEFSK
jgi:hypothetical protein